MLNIKEIRSLNEPSVIVFGNHAGIIQSILDFDYLSGKQRPGVVAIVGVTNKSLRYFYGSNEISIPGFVSINDVDESILSVVDFFAVAQSGRRAASTAEEALEVLPKALGGMIFAEDVPEKHTIKLREVAESRKKFILGPASVGMTVGGLFKLGAIGGTLPEQIASSGIVEPGSTAIISTSGGMINELISLVSKSGNSVSFAAAVGGERFPLTKPVELIAEAMNDKFTTAVVFFGELGGRDEYEIADFVDRSGLKKPIIAYVAGIVAEKFEAAPQFGHAKALAQNESETASAKKEALRKSGINVADSFADFEEMIRTLSKNNRVVDGVVAERLSEMIERSPALFHSTISSDKGGEVKILNEPLVSYVKDRQLSEIALSMFLGHNPVSKTTSNFFDLCLKLLVDHGPQVSGSVNTMITARAGLDLPAALATGILTVGPRFGGAIDQAAKNWLSAVASGEKADDFVEKFAKNKVYISGIGHKKYRIDSPDPRVVALLESYDKNGKYITFAREVSQITMNKKAQLILNVDGAVAALILDIMSEEEGYTDHQLLSLIDTGFCNAIFVYARSVGFIAHYLDQRRHDDGLFRLPDNLIG